MYVLSQGVDREIDFAWPLPDPTPRSGGGGGGVGDSVQYITIPSPVSLPPFLKPIKSS